MATRGGGDSGCATVVEPDGSVEVEIVMGLVVNVGVGAGCWFKNRWDEIGTYWGPWPPSLAVACRLWMLARSC